MEVHTSTAAYTLLSLHMTLDVEEFWSIALAANNKVLGIHQNFRGTVDQCLFHPRDIFRFAFLMNASKLIVAHNHPSGDPEPSTEDLEATESLTFIGSIAGIQIVDHLILVENNYTSIAQLCPKLFLPTKARHQPFRSR